LLRSDNTPKRLTPRELTFLIEYVSGRSAVDAYLTIRPDVEKGSAYVSGCRMLKRVLRKTDWPRLLESANLGEMRLIRELEARLQAKVTKHYQDQKLGEFEDNATRMKATELLADLLGKRKSELAISGHLEVNSAAEMSPDERNAWIKENLGRLLRSDLVKELLEAEGWKRPEGGGSDAPKA